MADAAFALGGRNARRNRVMVQFAYSTACRVGELVACRTAYLDLDRGRCDLWRPKRKDWLEGLVLPTSPDWVAYARAFAFSPRAHLFDVTTRRVQQIFKRAGEACGFPMVPVGRNGREVILSHPHVLRASRATHMIEDGMSIDLVQAYLGHSRVETTMGYVRQAESVLQAGARESDIRW